MEKRCVSLKHVGQASSLDSMHVMMSIVNKLPVHLKRAWIEKSVTVEQRTGQRAKFIDLSEFLTQQSRFANSIFGRETFPGREKIFRKKTSQHSAAAFASFSNPELKKVAKCYFCDGSHKIIFCEAFAKKSVEEQREFVHSKELCFKCLSGKHLARDCKSKEKCSVLGCTGTLHHKFLHRPARKLTSSNEVSNESSASSTAQASASCVTSSVYLNALPVQVQFQDEVKEVFLDQGSTTSFCDESSAKDLQAHGSDRCVTL